MTDDVRHIRTTSRSVLDRRGNAHRMHGYANSMANVRTMCGAEPTRNDIAKGDAIGMLTNGLTVVRPQWFADWCPACRERAEALAAKGKRR